MTNQEPVVDERDQPVCSIPRAMMLRILREKELQELREALATTRDAKNIQYIRDRIDELMLLPREGGPS